jgi:hypothetical protein
VQRQPGCLDVSEAERRTTVELHAQRNTRCSGIDLRPGFGQRARRVVTCGEIIEQPLLGCRPVGLTEGLARRQAPGFAQRVASRLPLFALAGQIPFERDVDRLDHGPPTELDTQFRRVTGNLHDGIEITLGGEQCRHFATHAPQQPALRALVREGFAQHQRARMPVEHVADVVGQAVLGERQLAEHLSRCVGQRLGRHVRHRTIGDGFRVGPEHGRKNCEAEQQALPGCEVSADGAISPRSAVRPRTPVWHSAG